MCEEKLRSTITGRQRELFALSANLATTVNANWSRLMEGGMIVDQDEVERSIKFVSDVLKAMSDHVKVSRIELVYEGFVDSLREYEARLHELVKGFEKAAEKDSIEEYTEIVTKISGKNSMDILGY